MLHGGWQVNGVAGKEFKMKMPLHAKSWFKYVVNAQAEIHTGRLDDAVESYNTILKSFALPDSEAYEIHLALGQVCVASCACPRCTGDCIS